jgi:hypothetical protein
MKINVFKNTHIYLKHTKKKEQGNRRKEERERKREREGKKERRKVSCCFCLLFIL